MATLTITDPGYGISDVTFDTRADLLAIYINIDGGRTEAIVLQDEERKALRDLLNSNS